MLNADADSLNIPHCVAAGGAHLVNLRHASTIQPQEKALCATFDLPWVGMPLSLAM